MRASAADTERSARLGRHAGFKGALCVEPEQVAALNRGFTPARNEDVELAAACQARNDAKRAAVEWAASV
jgi:citrate lyase beta subunit